MGKYETLQTMSGGFYKHDNPKALSNTERARLYRLRKRGEITAETPYDKQIDMVRNYKRKQKDKAPKTPNKFRQRLKKLYGLTLSQLAQYSPERQAEIFKKCHDPIDRRRKMPEPRMN